MSYEWTRGFLDKATMVPLAKKLNWAPAKSIGIFGADNCAYYNQQSFVRDGKDTHFLNTINWYQRSLPRGLVNVMHEEDDIYERNYEENKRALR